MVILGENILGMAIEDLMTVNIALSWGGVMGKVGKQRIFLLK